MNALNARYDYIFVSWNLTIIKIATDVGVRKTRDVILLSI